MDNEPKVVSRAFDYKFTIGFSIICACLSALIIYHKHSSNYWIGGAVYFPWALASFFYYYRFKFLLYQDKFEIWYRYTGKVHSVWLRDIVSWEERKKWLDARRSDKRLTLFTDKDKLVISSSDCKDYESLKEILTINKPLKENADEIAKQSGRLIISRLNRILLPIGIVTFLIFMAFILFRRSID